MVNPRQTSWASPEELSEVHNLLFNSPDPLQNQQGVDRINVWLSRGSCPQAIENTAYFVALMLRDASSVPVSQNELRLSYSMALIRFVNTLIDPLQTAYFAKSMAMLATQLGLPLWFIELRHAATHEDLPSLEVLRDASRQALDYLYKTFWAPALSSKPPPIDVAPLESILKSFKEHRKTVLRDNSQHRDVQPLVERTLRNFDGWVASNSISHGNEAALEAMADLLQREGYLVPLARSKRVNGRQADLSQALVNLWVPLIDHVDNGNEGFVDLLAVHLANRVSEGDGLLTVQGLLNTRQTSRDDNDKPEDYYMTLSCWVRYLVAEAESDSLRHDIVRSSLAAATPRSLKLVNMLVQGEEAAQAQFRPLIQALQSNDLTPSIDPADITIKLDEMEQKAKELEDQLAQRRQVPAKNPALDKSDGASNGWPVVESWTPQPIGTVPKGGAASHQSLYLQRVEIRS